MRFNPPLLAAGLLLSLTTLNAEASLTSYTANGVDLVRMPGGSHDVSWTRDGNLFKTLANNYAGGASAFVNAVIASVPGGKINDTPNPYDTPANSGYHTLSVIDFDTTTGGVSWFGAQAYVTYLNSINYGGSKQWRLPTWTDTGAAGPQFGYSGTDRGYNVNRDSSELARLYSSELGKKAYYNTSGVGPQARYGIFDNNNGQQKPGGAVGPFNNVLSSAYWFRTEYPSDENLAWVFHTGLGVQTYGIKNSQYYAWAVSPGLVAAVPAPTAVWLMGTGLLGLLGLKRRQA